MFISIRSGLLTVIAAFSVLAACLPARAFDGVVASIKPVHSLVSAVMEGIGEPALIVRGGGSEHAHSLRPSDARALENATIIFRVGKEMETFLNAPLSTLAGGSTIISLDDTPGLIKLDLREGGLFEGHSHDEDEAHHAHDLHIWLDPFNAQMMVLHIAQVLSDADPENALRYLANAQAYSDRLDSLVNEIEAIILPVREKPAVVFHDAYQYFEKYFGVNVVGSITVNPDIAPGAQRLMEIRDKVRELDAACVFSEPQFLPRLVEMVMEGTQARTGELDPLGVEIADGPDLYITLMHNLASSFAACLSGEK